MRRQAMSATDARWITQHENQSTPGSNRKSRRPREKEREENRRVLLPIRIDEATLESQYGWAAHLRRTRHIGDFRGWTDPKQYDEALERLLRDLQAGLSR